MREGEMRTDRKAGVGETGGCPAAGFGVKEGARPRDAGGLWKLGKARKQPLLWSLQKELTLPTRWF